MSQQPNEKYKLVNSGAITGDERVDSIITSPDGELGLLYKKALDLNKNKLKKSYIEASMLCEKDLARISSVVEIPLEVLQVYQEFFFNVAEWDRLSKIEHIEKLGVKDKNEMLLKMWALTHGIDFIAWRLGKRVSISPVDGLVDLFSTCIFKSKEAFFNGTTTETSKESVKWTKLSTDIARLLKLWVMDSSAAKKDLEIAIKEVVPEFEGLDTILDDVTLLNEMNEVNFDGIDDLNKESE